jgi:hypothetical protein
MINKQTTLDLNGPNISFTQQPVSVTTSISVATFVGIATVTFPSQTPANPASSTGTLTYRWHAEGFGALTDGTFRGATIAGTATTTLTLSNLKSPETNNIRFFLTADYIPSAYSQPVGSAVTVGTARSTGNAVNDLLTSNIATLTVNPFITITKQPTNTTVAPGGQATFDVDATLSDNRFGDLSYQWQSTGTVQNGTDGVVNLSSVWGIDARGRGATTTGGGGGGSGTTGYSGRPGSNGTAGTLGQGGNGGYLSVYGDNPGNAGGGGGGFYGGGGGGVNSNYGSAGSGGGGAGFIIGGSPEVATRGYRSGNGIILVSWTLSDFSSIAILSLNLNKSGSLDVSISTTGSYTEYRAYVDGVFRTSSSTTTINNIPITSGADRTLSIEFLSGDTLLHTLTTYFRLFEYTGSSQSWVVPSGVGLLMSDVQGAQGGSNPGSGGRIKGNISVIPGNTIYMLVGGQGGSEFETTCRPTYPSLVAGGFNGGGTGGGSQDSYLCPSGQSFYRRGAGGGGASDIRTSASDLATRLIIAGGGGGGSYGGGLGGVGDGAGQNLTDQSSPLIRGSKTKTLTISANTLGITGIRAVVSNPNAQSVISNVVSFDVVTPRALLGIESYPPDAPAIGGGGRANFRTYDLLNGPFRTKSIDEYQIRTNQGSREGNWDWAPGAILVVYAPERDIRVRITMAGGSGSSFNLISGLGGLSTFDYTFQRNDEYVFLLGHRMVDTLGTYGSGTAAYGLTTGAGGGGTFLYRKSKLVAAVGGGGDGPQGGGGRGGGVNMSGEPGTAYRYDGGVLKTVSGGRYIPPGTFLQGRLPSGSSGGEASSCSNGTGVINASSVPACQDFSGLTQFRSSSNPNTPDSRSAFLSRGFKAGYPNAFRYNGFGGGCGAAAGSGEVTETSNIVGGGGSGYSDGSISLINSVLGGNTDSAQRSFGFTFGTATVDTFRQGFIHIQAL